MIAEELKSSFSVLNIQVDAKTLEKCVKLCETYRIDPEEFVDQWFAFTASRLNGAAPSISGLEQLERKELQKLSKQSRPNNNSSSIETTPKRLPQTPSVIKREKENTHSTPKALAVQQKVPISKPIVPAENETLGSNSRKIHSHYGKVSTTGFKNLKACEDLNVKIQNYDEKKNHKYMYEKMGTRRDCLNYMTYMIGEEIKNYYALKDADKPLQSFFGEMTVLGRVYSESDKMQKNSVIFESTVENSRGHVTNLDLSKIDQARLFPGQVVVARGNNTKSSLIAQKIFSGVPAINLNHATEFPETLQIVVAAGPYSSSDDLTFEPLSALIDHIIENKPDVVILIGPFLPKDHQSLSYNFAESYDSYFEALIRDLLGRIAGCTKLVLIPSCKDVHGAVVYPTIPYDLNFKHPDLILAPDPCIINIEGILMGLTSVDILDHLNDKDLVINENIEDMRRTEQLSRYVVTQRCFYPLHPSHIDVPIDFQLLESMGFMDPMPHLLVLPSSENFYNFITKIDECVVINPERLAKGNQAGTFACVEVRPGTGAVHTRTSCKIVHLK